SDEYLHAPEAEANLAMCLYDLGHKDEAISRLTNVLRRRPWNVNLRLTLYDLVHRIHMRKGNVPDSLAVLLYTFNKSGELDATLERVFESELTGAKVHVLDNGSSDRTGEVCASWLKRVGGNKLAVHSLPTNIGAPAARNWLLSLDEVRSCEFVAFLDDDAQPPRDWIRRLATAQELYPEAGAWGCRVHDAGISPFTQSADLQPRPAYGAKTNHPETSDLHLQGLDPGYFKYIRPALSVTGCCHLFPRKSFDLVGGFDLRYSPSQLDDLDLDLRLAERETPPIYQGHLGVGHLKRTGVLSETDAKTAANSRGNKEKLNGKYAGERWNFIRSKMFSILRMDLEEKSNYLEKLLKP
ncbi:MAG: glycosyltransferase family A protein, partial [Oceanidesulfovibrio sp.]